MPNIQSLIITATKNIQDILNDSIQFDPAKNQALIVFDSDNELTKILTKSYKKVLPQATFIDFNQVSKEEIIANFNQMKESDLVVLIQSGSFRLDEFRIRLHLFNLKLKVIEHMHLYRNTPDTWQIYIDSLEYNKNWYHKMGDLLQQKLADCKTLQLQYTNDNQHYQLVVNNGLEVPKLNTGEYSNLKNVGGTFPIGEVFTEARDLKNMNGSFWVYAFANSNFEVIMPEKFRVDVKDGLICGHSNNAPEEFLEVLEKVKQQERPIIREIGFGLNRAVSKTNPLGDITAFERVVGLHLSLGEKHSVYKKPGITAHKARFHVDLFLVVDKVFADEEIIFEGGEYV